jgi:hypothetical protein
MTVSVAVPIVEGLLRQRRLVNGESKGECVG